ncbi:hypothetical protein [Cellulophaga baltica]|uniref:hypothetical protein n=1 Tax=Cellulophaga baltica TaxID=76594 RepID=UPI0024954E69|nr:hypothetical protein [Cellulophaga baltica]
MFIFFLFGKFYIIAFLSIWFLTILDWWRYFLFPSIILVSLQAYSVFESVLGANENYVSVGVGIGIVYVIVLHFLHRTSKIYRANTIHMMTFDIIKLISTYTNEKSLVNSKQKIIAEHEREILLKNQNDWFINKIKILQFHLTRNHKFVFKLLIIKNNYKIDYIIATLLIIAPILLKIYVFLPEAGDSVLRIGSFSYDTHFNSAFVFLYYFSIKFFHFFLLSIWFFTTKSIFKYGIFFNLILAVFQLVSILDNTSSIDETELWTALPIMIPILLTFLLLHRIIKYKSKNEILNEEIEQEIQEVLTAINALEEHEDTLVAELISLRENQSDFSKAAYQKELLRIKAAIERKIATD